MKLSNIVAFGAIGFAITVMPGAARGWERIGFINSAPARFPEVLTVVSPRPYSQIKICAGANPVRISRVRINSLKGERMDAVNKPLFIKAQGCTRPIRLVGGPRKISSISMIIDNFTPGSPYYSIKVFAM